MRNHIVLDIDRSKDDGDLESRTRRFGLRFNFVYAPNSPLRGNEWSRWTQVLPGYVRAARRALAGMGRHDRLIFLTAGLALIAAILRSLSAREGPEISVLNFIYRRRFGLVGPFIEIFVRQALNHFAFIGVPSREAAEDYFRRFPKAASRVQVFPTWCGFPENPPSVTQSKGLIFSGGRSLRDYRTLLEALRALNVPASLATSRAAVNAIPIPENVRLYFDVPPDTFANLMMRATIVVVPLYPVRFDAGQSVVLQAMCYGKPVVATNTAGLSEYIEHGRTGLLVPPSDAHALALAMKSLLGNPTLRSSIGEEARRVYRERYSRDVFVLRLASVFGESSVP